MAVITHAKLNSQILKRSFIRIRFTSLVSLELIYLVLQVIQDYNTR